MKICIIGPADPFRGGISHHTTLLCRELRTKHEVHYFSYKRQYPRFFFPGETDRDFKSKYRITEPDVVYALDSLNPVTWVQTALSVAKKKPDLVIFPWWTFYWTFTYAVIISILKLKSYAKVLFYCQNVYDHEASALKKKLTQFILGKGDYFLVHSQDENGLLRTILGDKKRIRVVHQPLFNVFDLGQWTAESARRRLGLKEDEKVILFFGFIRLYKGISCLMEAFARLIKQIDVHLVIAGESWQKKDLLSGFPEDLAERVHWIRTYVPNEEIEIYFKAADLVVLPYSKVSGSGILQIAYSFNKPVVASRIGCFAEMIVEGKTGFLVPPDNVDALYEALLAFFKKPVNDYAHHIESQKERFSWVHVRNAIEEIVQHE